MSGWEQIDRFLATEDVETTVWFIGGAENLSDNAQTVVDKAVGVYSDRPVGVITGGTASQWMRKNSSMRPLTP